MKRSFIFFSLTLSLLLFSCKKDETMETRLDQIEGRWLIVDSYFEINGRKESSTDFKGVEFTFKKDKSFTGINLLISGDFITGEKVVKKVPSRGYYSISDDGKILSLGFSDGYIYSNKIETLNKKKLVLRVKSENRELVEVYTKK